MSTNCIRCVKNKRTGTDLLCDECRAPSALAAPTGSAAPTTAGYYWFTGTGCWPGEWRLVKVFRPLWTDPKRTDLRWQYLDGSGGVGSECDVATCAGKWSVQVLPPNRLDKEKDGE